MIRCTCLILLLATPATPEPFITGPEFASHTTGRTIGFTTIDGWLAGTEHYLPGKRVLWHREGSDICQTGSWYEHRFSEGPAICFRYDGQLIPVCWYMTLQDTRLSVRRVTSSSDILIESPDPATLPCSSPFLGS